MRVRVVLSSRIAARLVGIAFAVGIATCATAEPVGTSVTTKRAAAASRPSEQACPPGEWIQSTTAAWVRRVVEHAGYPLDGCTGSAWLSVTPLTGFAIWATGPWRHPPGMRPYTEAGLQNAFTDGTRVMWEAQGLAVWVAPGPKSSDRLPGKSALGGLQAATYLVPRRYMPILFMATPDSVLRGCRSDPDLAPVCPTRIPRVSLEPVVRWGRTYPSLRTYPRVVNGVFGIERWGQTGPDLIRPPIVHIEVEAAVGRPRGFRFQWPTTGRIAARNGLLRDPRVKPVYLGRVTWGGKAGSIALSPGYPLGGSQADHVVFRWRSGRTTYLVGMHAWEPFTEALTTLRRVVASVPR